MANGMKLYGDKNEKLSSRISMILFIISTLFVCYNLILNE